jgi:hypothetical protein
MRGWQTAAESVIVIASYAETTAYTHLKEFRIVYTVPRTKRTEAITMTRQEYNEFRYIRSYEKKFDLGPGTTLTIRTDASAEYKRRLDALYRSWGFHPASVRVDSRMFDEKERVIYIHGLTFDLRGEQHPWSELFTNEERARFAAALD